MTSSATVPTSAETTMPLMAPNMTLRDWFAGQALEGLWASPDYCMTPERTAKQVYAMADAMLAERDGSVQ